MKKYAKSVLIFLIAAGAAITCKAQVAADSTDQHLVAATAPGSADSSKSPKELEASLTKAAAAAEKAARKIKIIAEQKADKLARTSQPYIESLAASTATLIEKLAQELDKMVDEPAPKKAR
ncbi:hypothetical protein [Niabella drilacis]|uniref:Uncharacterized protein n=1 Tax=Niabella drilacis (strain DSM 25811 / CCM 8410 / CCUG 62505 / LMG 26954 / E90) TaxID=1285928 RepID=A0A1G6ZI26_NIADE|nr:hypothetical protein [Niabella drilacis]SDE02180.1 hypothetical protein SAMN04487894_11858 [Niabella drilacis]